MNRPIQKRVAASAFFFLCGMIFSSWAVRIPGIKDQFSLNEAELGALLFLLPFGSLVALPFAGWVVARAGSSGVLTAFSIGYVLFLLGISLSPSLWVLGVVLFLFGFCGDVVNIAMNAQALQVQEEIYRKPIMASFHGLWSLGAMTGAAAGGLLVRLGTGILIHFITLAALVIMSSLFFYPRLVHAKKEAGRQALFGWPDKALWLLGAICFCCTLCEGAMSDWSSLYYMQTIGMAGKVSTTGYTSYAVMMALGRLVGDSITARLGYRGILLLDSLLIVSGLAMAIGFQHYLAVIAGFGLVGLGVGTIIPIVYTLSVKNSKLPPSTALAAVSTVGFSGFLVGPPIIGMLAHQVSLRWALLLVLLLALLIGWLSKFVRVS